MVLSVPTRFLATYVALIVFAVAAAKEYPIPPAPISPPAKVPSYKCPTGYDIEGDLCVMTIEEQPTAVCTWGMLQGDICVKEYPAEVVCPPDFTLIETTSPFRHSLYSKKSKKAKSFHHSDEIGEARCQRILTSPPVPQCPEGYVLKGHLCHTVKYINPVCPQGTVDLPEGGCAYYKPIQKRCPPGFASSISSYHKHGSKGAKCMRVNRADAQRICRDDGYTMTPDQSQCERINVLSPVCPSGTVEVGNECAYYKPVEKRCPPGYEGSFGKYHKSGCFRVHSAEPFPVCRDGYDLDEASSKCTKVTLLPLVCPRPSTDVEGICLAHFPAEPRCPPEFSLTRRHSKGSEPICVKSMNTAPLPVCAEDYFFELDGDDHRCVKVVPKTPICPRGTQEDEQSGECVSYMPADSQCPDGFERISTHVSSKYHKKDKSYGVDKCVQTQTVNPMVSCTKEFSLLSADQGICEKVVGTPATAVCKQGARHGDACVEYSPVQPMYDCPQGYTKEGNRCVQTVDYDCSTVEYETECHEAAPCVGKECELNYDHHKLRSLKVDDEGVHDYIAKKEYFSKKTEHFGNSLHKEKDSSKQYHTAHKSKHSPSNLICEKVAVHVEKTCQKPLYADASFTCPPESESQGNGCVLATYYPFEFVCHDGLTLEGGQCVKTLQKPAEFSCPDGFDMTETPAHYKLKYTPVPRTCVRSLSVNPEFICSKGLLVEGNRCAKYFSKECPNGECEHRIVVASDYECPLGFTLSSSGNGSACIATETLPVNYFCEKGVLDEDGQCAEVYAKECPAGGCHRTLTLNPMYQCPDGFQNSHSKGRFSTRKMTCSAKETVDYEYFCSKGESVMEGEKCVKYVSKECPAGQCHQTNYTPVDYECPIGFEMEKSKATRSVYSRKPMYVKSKKSSSHSQKEQDESSLVCSNTEYAEHEGFCSKGEMVIEGDRCAQYVEKECPKGGCDVHYDVSSTFVCPAGYTKPSAAPSHYKHKVHKDNGVTHCQAVEYVEPAYRCEKGMLDKSGTMCVKTSHPDIVCSSQRATLTHDNICVTRYENPLVVENNHSQYIPKAEKPTRSSVHHLKDLKEKPAHMSVHHLKESEHSSVHLLKDLKEKPAHSDLHHQKA